MNVLNPRGGAALVFDLGPILGMGFSSTNVTRELDHA